MSRTVITAVVGVVIATLTAIAFLISNVGFKDRMHERADAQLARAYQVVQRLHQLEGVEVSNIAERMAARPEFIAAIRADGESEQANQARLGFQQFMASDKLGAQKPDIAALVSHEGNLVAMYEVSSITPSEWRNDAKNVSNPTQKPTVIPALNVVLGRRVIVSDLWNNKGTLMKIGVAPIIDVAADDPETPIGAIVVAYAVTAKSAKADKALLGTEIAYFDGQRVVASSFTGGAGEDLGGLMAKDALNSKQTVTLGGTDYIAASVKMPGNATKPLPKEYPAPTAGAVVLALASESGDSSLGLFILLLGGGSLGIALLGIYLTHRRLVAQVDQIEQGVTDIINGNVDRTFRPVGYELDGLANGLNVMLARLLGRPEPGEEEFDEDGNPIIPGRVEFEEGEDKPAVDPDLAALTQESEPDYYKRVYTEYIAARKVVGAPDDVSFENFIAKLKVNEGKLRAQYQCRAVRFRVVTKDGKVSLKPVPIFE